MEILDTTIATASLTHIAVGGAVAVGLGVALADFLIGRCTVQFGTRWLILLQTVLWISSLIYVIATIHQAIFASWDVAMETRLAALCVFLLTGLLGAFAFTLRRWHWASTIDQTRAIASARAIVVLPVPGDPSMRTVTRPGVRAIS